MSRRLTSFAALAMAPLLTFAACGGESEKAKSADKPSASTAPSDSASTSTEPAETQTPDPADVALAESALLTLDDFPTGWEAERADDDSDEGLSSDQKDIAECVGVDPSVLYDPHNAEAETPTFSNEDDEEIDHRVVIDPDEAALTSNFETFKSPEYLDCFADSMEATFKDGMKDIEKEGGSVGEITINQVNLGSFGDDTAAFRLTIPVEMSGLSLDFVLDYAAVRIGRAMLSVTTSRNSLGSIDVEDETEFIQLATDRLVGVLPATP